MLKRLKKQNSVKKYIYIVFRMDDYAASSDTDLERRIMALFQKKKIKYTFGVVPFMCSGNPKDPSFQDLNKLSNEKGLLLKKEIKSGCLDIALHGFSHQTSNNNELNPSEFSGLAYEEQIRRLSAGKQLLENLTQTPVKSFIPPWNQYDKNTLKALEKSGLYIISAGWKGAVAKESNIDFLPATCNLNMLKDAIKAARISSDEQPIIVVLFHHYDFKESQDRRASISLQDFSKLLDSLISQKDLRFMSIGTAKNIIADVSAMRFLNAARWRSAERFLPARFHEKKPILIYHEAGILHETQLKVGIIYGLTALFFFIIAFIAGIRLFPLLSTGAVEALFYGCVLSATGVLAYIFKHNDSPAKLLVGTASIGCFAGIITVYLLQK